MSFSVIPSNKFKKEAKRLIKKFPSLKQELLDVGATLEEEPATGTPARIIVLYKQLFIVS